MTQNPGTASPPKISNSQLTSSRRRTLVTPTVTTTTPPVVVGVTMLNDALTNTNIGSSTVLVAAPGSGQIALFYAELVSSSTSEQPYIATSDYGSSPAATKLLAASINGLTSRRGWAVGTAGLVLPAGIGITVYSAPSSGNVVSCGVSYAIVNT